jgi:hypothetical protein
MTANRNRNTSDGYASRIQMLIIGGTCLSLVGLAMACAPPAPTTPAAAPTVAPNPTLQAAATEIGGAARAVATAQGGIAQPTTSAAQTQVASSAPGAATVVAPTVQSAATAVTTAVTGLATQVAPTVSAAKTEIAPTVVAAGTSVAGAAATSQIQQATSVTIAREGTATAVAPTAQALATHVAPTVQAAATQIVTAAGTSVAKSPIQVVGVSVGSTDTTVSFQNNGSSPVNLAGWTLVLGPDFSVVLNEMTVKAGQTRQLHFTQGTDTESDVYMGFGSAVAKASLQPGARVVLISPPDQIASVYSVS